MKALEEAYRSERGRLSRYLARRAGRDNAPDLVHDVFVRAAASRYVNQLDNPAAFLSRVARNLIIDRVRRAKAAPAVFLPFDEQYDLASLPDQTWAIEEADMKRAYADGIAAMPEKTRRVFLMHREHGCPYQEIADQIGISKATVEYHMMRALAMLRRRLLDC